MGGGLPGPNNAAPLTAAARDCLQAGQGVLRLLVDNVEGDSIPMQGMSTLVPSRTGALTLLKGIKAKGMWIETKYPWVIIISAIP